MIIKNHVFSIEERMKLPYMIDLERISVACIRLFARYPVDHCYLPSRIIKLRHELLELGGNVHDPLTGEMINEANHIWSYDAERNLYIDLTLFQYDESLPMVSILRPSSSILVPTQELTVKARNQDLLGHGKSQVFKVLSYLDEFFPY